MMSYEAAKGMERKEHGEGREVHEDPAYKEEKTIARICKRLGELKEMLGIKEKVQREKGICHESAQQKLKKVTAEDL